MGSGIAEVAARVGPHVVVVETRPAAQALADRDLAIEAIAEDERAKIAVFQALDRIVQDPRRSWRPTPLRSRS
jgi:3-hydroxyacyl-CoA dehydrogenase